jgi:hypothetical protein
VRCRGCGGARWVPVDRPTRGPDDPHAIPPKRGIPFEADNPYRLRPGERGPGRTPRKTTPQPSGSQAPQPRGEQPAPRSERPPRPAASRPAPNPAPRRSAPPEPAQRPPAPKRAFFGTPRSGRHSSPPMREVPPPVPPIPAVPPRPGASFTVPAHLTHQSSEIQPYRPCEYCSKAQIRTRKGTWPAAVAQLQVWEGQRFHGNHYACEQHLRQATEQPEPGWTVHIIERGMNRF